MKRDQLEHAIRAACQIIDHPAVIIVGSQAILGTFGEDELPVEATMSVEIDVLPIADSDTVTAELADLIEGVAGEWSPFEEQHGFSIDGVDLDTAVLPQGWRDRLVWVQNVNTAAPSGRPQFIGWCLQPEDLCVAKLCAHREKDLNFVRALHEVGLVNGPGIADRLLHVAARHQRAAADALTWLRSLRVPAVGASSPRMPPSDTAVVDPSADQVGTLEARPRREEGDLVKVSQTRVPVHQSRGRAADQDVGVEHQCASRRGTHLERRLIENSATTSSVATPCSTSMASKAEAAERREAICAA